MYGGLGGFIFIIFYVTLVLLYKMCSKKSQKSEEYSKLLQDKKDLRKSWKGLRKTRYENEEIEGYLKKK